MRFGEFLKLVFKDLRAVGVQAALLIALSVVIPVIDIVAPGVLGRALAVLVSQQEASQSIIQKNHCFHNVIILHLKSLV